MWEEAINAVPMEPVPHVATESKVTEAGLPYVVGRGVLPLSGFEIEVFQLSTGLRIVAEDSLREFFHMPEIGESAQTD